MQIVLYVHANQEELPEHAKVIEVTAATADGVRTAAHGAVDALLNDIKAGWTPPVPETAEAAQTPVQEWAEGVVSSERPGQRSRSSSGGGRKGGERMPSKPKRRR